MQLVGEGDCHGHSGLPVIRLHHHRCGVLREAVRKIKNHSIKCPDPAEQSFLLVKHPNPALPTVYLRAIGDIVLEDSTVGAVSEDNVVGHHRDCSTSHSTLVCDVFGTGRVWGSVKGAPLPPRRASGCCCLAEPLIPIAAICCTGGGCCCCCWAGGGAEVTALPLPRPTCCCSDDGVG